MRYRQIYETMPNLRNIHVRRIWHLMDRCNNLEKYNVKEDFDCVFALERTWPLTRADWPLSPR